MRADDKRRAPATTSLVGRRRMFFPQDEHDIWFLARVVRLLSPTRRKQLTEFAQHMLVYDVREACETDVDVPDSSGLDQMQPRIPKRARVFMKDETLATKGGGE